MNDELKNILTTVFGLKISEINVDLTRDDIARWDSLTQMDLVTSLEEKFNIELTFEEIVKLNSFKTILDLLSSRGITNDV